MPGCGPEHEGVIPTTTMDRRGGHSSIGGTGEFVTTAVTEIECLASGYAERMADVRVEALVWTVPGLVDTRLVPPG
jgi:hypothetical protein